MPQNYRSPQYQDRDRMRDDNSGAWIIGIIVLVAIGIGVWWWSGWGGNDPVPAQTKSQPK